MNIKKVLTNIIAVSILLLLNIFGFALHASAVPMGSHEMSGMNHEASSPTSCATLCRTAVLATEEVTIKVAEEENDGQGDPYYMQFQTYTPDGTGIKSKLYASDVKPPPKIPIYIFYSVIRV